MTRTDGWSYTEQLLHTLDEFQTPDGFRIKHLDRWDGLGSGVLGCWRISLRGAKPNDVQSRFNVWLTMVDTGWMLSDAPALRWTAEPFETADEAITRAKEFLRAREAAQRLGAATP
jgi:hypothetical protein